MICQIYSMKTVEEALLVIEAGADYIGLTPTQGDLPGKVSMEQAISIFKAVGDKAVKVALSVDDNEDNIMNMVTELKPDILHLSGFNFQASADFVKNIKNHFPNLRVMQAIAVDGLGVIEKAKHFSDFVDLIILDSVGSDISAIGASGKTSDWNICRQIVEACKVPVILAGGLSPENVEKAIEIVKPWGVDTMTMTDKINSDGSSSKDIDKVKEFCRIAKKGCA